MPTLWPHGRFTCVDHAPQCPRHVTHKRSQGGSASITALSWPRAFAHAAALPERSSAFPPQPSCLVISTAGQPLTPPSPLLCGPGHTHGSVLGAGTWQTLSLLGQHSVTLNN